MCFFCAHFFHCLALYFCFVDTSSTISFYISLGSYEKKLAAPLPLWQHFYIANSIFMHFFALLRTSPLHPLAFVVFLCLCWFFNLLFIWFHAKITMCTFSRCFFLVSLAFSWLILVCLCFMYIVRFTIRASWLLLHHNYSCILHFCCCLQLSFSCIILFSTLHFLFAKLFSIFKFFLFHVCKFLLFGFYFAISLMQVFMCLQFPIAFYIKQCKVIIFILTFYSYFFPFFSLPFTIFVNVKKCCNEDSTRDVLEILKKAWLAIAFLPNEMFDLHPFGFELPKYKDRLNAIFPRLPLQIVNVNMTSDHVFNNLHNCSISIT